MRLLLDTHIFLWFITGDSRLPAAVQSAIQDPANEVYLRGNLIGWDRLGRHRFTWQPHGSQFTVVEDVPTESVAFRLRLPDEPMTGDATLKALGFDAKWIETL